MSSAHPSPRSSRNDTQSLDPEFVIGSYRVGRTIGQGTYGKVRMGVHVDTGEKVAIKVIEKSQVQSAKQIARLQREIRFLKLLHHPHIVRLYDVIETAENIFIMMEYASGGELFDYIVANKRVKENEARSFFRMVLSAIDYCHQNAIIHRDLKPENLLLDDKKCIKIIDFGFGNNFSTEGLLDTFCGSPFYAAPEMILGKKYEGPEVDMWSLGVILFALLCGHLPFDDDNMKELYRKIASGSYKCPDYLLPNSRHLISRLITVDPKKRATLQEVMNHPWVNEGYNYAPPSYIPERAIIRDATLLSKDTINRLLIFGYKMEDIERAFGPNEDHSIPNPIRSTYHLLTEMVAREQSRLKREKKRIESTNLLKEKSKSSASMVECSSATLVSEQEMNQPIAPQDKPSRRHTLMTEKIQPPPSAYTINRSQVNKVPIQANVYASPNQAFVSLPTVYHDVHRAEMNTPDKTSSLVQAAANQFHRWYSVPSNIYQTIADTTSGFLGSKDESQTPHSNDRDESKPTNGWFMNLSTTSSKPPCEIIAEIARVLSVVDARWKFETDFRILCEVDIRKLLSKRETGSNLMDIDGTEHQVEEQPRSDNRTGNTGTISSVTFQIEVCKVPKSSLHGLYFKRLQGGVWNYKKICNKLLAAMAL